ANPPVKIVSEIDPYYEWRVKFQTLLVNKLAEVNACKREALIIGTNLQIIRRDVDLLQASIDTPVPPPAVHPTNRTSLLDLLGSQENEYDPLETTSDRLAKAVAARVYGILVEAPATSIGLDEPIGIDPQLRARTQQKILELRSQIEMQRRQIDAL